MDVCVCMCVCVCIGDIIISSTEIAKLIGKVFLQKSAVNLLSRYECVCLCVSVCVWVCGCVGVWVWVWVWVWVCVCHKHGRRFVCVSARWFYVGSFDVFCLYCSVGCTSMWHSVHDSVCVCVCFPYNAVFSTPQSSSGTHQTSSKPCTQGRGYAKLTFILRPARLPVFLSLLGCLCLCPCLRGPTHLSLTGFPSCACTR